MRKRAFLMGAGLLSGVAALGWHLSRPRTAPRQIRFIPTNWDRAADGAGWHSTWAGLRIQVYSQVQPDDQRQRFRFECDIRNTTRTPVSLASHATLTIGQTTHRGELLRLFAPQSLMIDPHGTAGFAALFDLDQPLWAVADRALVIRLTARDGTGRSHDFTLSLQAHTPS